MRPCLALNEPLAAIEAIEQAASLRPDHAPTAAALSQAYAAAGRRERAVRRCCRNTTINSIVSRRAPPSAGDPLRRQQAFQEARAAPDQRADPATRRCRLARGNGRHLRAHGHDRRSPQRLCACSAPGAQPG
ncbi:MAG: hypothetical protein RMJ54_07170 [Roseiflexaceae bacterium]|nr:hypothetical protein [Roseiflexaceae bacterium]